MAICCTKCEFNFLQHATWRCFGCFTYMAYVSDSICFTHKKFLLFCFIFNRLEYMPSLLPIRIVAFFQSVIVALFPKHFQLSYKSLTNQACWDCTTRILDLSLLRKDLSCCTVSILTRPWNNMFPVWSSCLVNKIHTQCIALVYS